MNLWRCKSAERHQYTANPPVCIPPRRGPHCNAFRSHKANRYSPKHRFHRMPAAFLPGTAFFPEHIRQYTPPLDTFYSYKPCRPPIALAHCNSVACCRCIACPLACTRQDTRPRNMFVPCNRPWPANTRLDRMYGANSTRIASRRRRIRLYICRPRTSGPHTANRPPIARSRHMSAEYCHNNAAGRSPRIRRIGPPNTRCHTRPHRLAIDLQSRIVAAYYYPCIASRQAHTRQCTSSS